MRITYEGTDYSYCVLTKSINRLTKVIHIRLLENEYELRPDQKGEWKAVDVTINDHMELLNAIARSIKLRYSL